MWLASRFEHNFQPAREALFREALFELSPEIGRVEHVYLISFGAELRYWRTQGGQDGKNGLDAKLSQLAIEYGLQSWVLAPTGPWAFFLARHQSQEGLRVFSPEQIEELSKSWSLVEHARTLIEDLWDVASTEDRSQWHRMLEELQDYGVNTFRDLRESSQSSDFRHLAAERGGSLFAAFLGRLLLGADDLRADRVQLDAQFEHVFYPLLEESLSVPLEDLFERIMNVVTLWCTRLERRRQLMKFFRVEVLFESVRKEPARRIDVELRFPRATTDLALVRRVFLESWTQALRATTQLSSSQMGAVDPRVEKVRIFSNAFEWSEARQLGLFEEIEVLWSEARLDQWNELVTRLLAGAPKSPQLEIGFWGQNENYFPEFSQKWFSWDALNDSVRREKFPERWDALPSRPPLIARRPERARHPELSACRSEKDFFDVVMRRGAFSCFEKISDAKRGTERSYVRFQGEHSSESEDWIFWDHVKKAVFVHGHYLKASAWSALSLPEFGPSKQIPG